MRPARPEPAGTLLGPSTTDFERPPSRVTTRTLRALAALRLTRLTTHPATGQILAATNLTLPNFVLVHIGPTGERGLVVRLMGLQVRTARSRACLSLSGALR